MIDKTNVIDAVCERLRKMPDGDCLALRTYKRNRSVYIVKETGDALTIVEEGFYRDRFTVPREKLRKTLRTLLKREFPRSRKVRVYSLGRNCDEN